MACWQPATNSEQRAARANWGAKFAELLSNQFHTRLPRRPVANTIAGQQTGGPTSSSREKSPVHLKGARLFILVASRLLVVLRPVFRLLAGGRVGGAKREGRRRRGWADQPAQLRRRQAAKLVCLAATWRRALALINQNRLRFDSQLEAARRSLQAPLPLARPSLEAPMSPSPNGENGFWGSALAGRPSWHCVR